MSKINIVEVFARLLLPAIKAHADRVQAERWKDATLISPCPRVTVEENGEVLLWAAEVRGFTPDFLLVGDSSEVWRFRRADGCCIDREGWRLRDDDLLAEVRKVVRRTTP